MFVFTSVKSLMSMAEYVERYEKGDDMFSKFIENKLLELIEEELQQHSPELQAFLIKEGAIILQNVMEYLLNKVKEMEEGNAAR